MIENPNMRKELIEYLTGLSDLQYQQDCWVNNQCPDGVEHDEFDYTVHFLFDDTMLAENTESMIGYCLNDNKEADAVSTVCSSIDGIFQKYGEELSDAEYLACPEWQGVVDSARNALLALKNN